MNNKRILFVIPAMQQGGAERVVSVMANYWAEKQHTVSIIYFNNEESYYPLNKTITLYPLHSAKNNFWIANFIVNNILRTINYFKAVKKIGPDIIISFTDNANVYCILYNFLLKKPLIITQRTNPRFNTLPGIISWLPRRIYKRAQAIVLQTAQTLKIYKELDVELPLKTAIIYNPLPESSFAGTGSISRENLVLAVGRLYNKDKHFDKLIRIFNSIDNTGWQLQVAGDGPDRENLQALVNKLHLQDKVQLLGTVKDTAALYQRAKIFALTSQFEGFPNALCEAMANGCACISYDCATGPSEIINNGKNGLLIESQNETAFARALSALMNDEAAMQKFSTTSLSIRELLDEKNIMDQWELLIGEVTTSHNK